VPSAKTSATGNVVSFLSTNETTAPFGLRTMIYGASAIANRYITLQATDYATTDGGSIVLQPSIGNVGIGTTMPDEKLSVLGKIHANEVKVDLSVPGPDYVFKLDYKLPTLTEVKAYVDKNHHLPEIPSADDMAKNGLSLGDMNTKLLKKVEELTLYLIEKDKQFEEQKLALASVQKQLNQIKKQFPKRNAPATANN
jgi:hypothetical protein